MLVERICGSLTSSKSPKQTVGTMKQKAPKLEYNQNRTKHVENRPKQTQNRWGSGTSSGGE